MAPNVYILPPNDREDIYQLDLWWTVEFQGLEFGSIMHMVFLGMYKNWLRLFIYKIVCVEETISFYGTSSN